MVRIHLPPPLKNNAPQTRCFFLCVREIAPAGAAAQSAAGGETSGSTARSAEREDVAQATPQGNPFPTTSFTIKELRQKVATPFLFLHFLPDKL